MYQNLVTRVKPQEGVSDDSECDSVIFQTLGASGDVVDHWNHVQPLNALEVVRVLFELLLSLWKSFLWEVEKLEEQKPELGSALIRHRYQQVVRRRNG